MFLFHQIHGDRFLVHNKIETPLYRPFRAEAAKSLAGVVRVEGPLESIGGMLVSGDRVHWEQIESQSNQLRANARRVKSWR